MTPIISGEVAEDFTNYFAKSEQTPTVIALGVLVNKDGIEAAGGYKLSLMPDATEEEISKIEEQIKDIEPISKMLDKDISLEEIAKIVTGDESLQVLSEVYPKYECSCSRGKTIKNIVALGEAELNKMIEEEEKIEIVCNFCNKKYEFAREELKKILEEAKK